MRKLTTREARRRLRDANPSIRILDPYKGYHIPIRCKCEVCQHVWRPSLSNLEHGRGCPRCAGRGEKLTIAEIRRRLKVVNPKVRVEGEYHDSSAPLACRCLTCGNEWAPCWSSLNRGYGCPKCSFRKARDWQRLTLPEIRTRLRKMKAHITIISDKYVNAWSPILFSCTKCSTKWESNWAYVGKHALCPNCNPHRYGISEEKTRKIFERVTGWKFPKAKPAEIPWLHGLHLDGWNRRHKVVFEHQGYQHYTWDTHFGSGSPKEKKLAFAKLRKRDMRKRFQCKYHGYTFISVPYWKTPEEVAAMVREKLPHL